MRNESQQQNEPSETKSKPTPDLADHYVEYQETSAYVRHYSSLRFAMLTVYFAVVGGLGALDCSQLGAEIDRLKDELKERVTEEQAIQRALAQGVLGRTYAQAIYKYWQHKGQYDGKQKRLNRLLEEYDRRPCEPPQAQDTYYWAKREFPGDDYIWESYRASLKEFLINGPPRPNGPVFVPGVGPGPIPVMVR